MKIATLLLLGGMVLLAVSGLWPDRLSTVRPGEAPLSLDGNVPPPYPPPRP